jgi:MinD-like ATPase involved in chromosome partitioning or flagellar assembly
MKSVNMVEQFDTMSEVLRFKDNAKKVYTKLKRKYELDYCFIDTEEGLKYKVKVRIYE